MWELLYETFWDRLEHFCFNLCRDEARAEDLTQEVFLRALQNRSLINSFTERQCKVLDKHSAVKLHDLILSLLRGEIRVAVLKLLGCDKLDVLRENTADIVVLVCHIVLCDL